MSWGPFGDPLLKARGLTDARDEAEDEVAATKQAKTEEKEAGPAPQPKGWNIDPLNVLSMGADETVSSEHPGTFGVPFITLSMMARVPDISAIVNVRISQLAEGCSPQETEHSLGYLFRLKDRKAQPTKAQQKEIAHWTDWIQTCGDPRIDPDATLEGFVRSFMRDSLIWDQACAEKVRTRGRKLAGFQALDGSTIRRMKPSAEERRAGRRDPDKLAFVQVVNNKIAANWQARDFMFCIRRPRTALWAAGYGYPELDELINVVTWMLSADSYNAANFKNGMHSSGLIALVTKMNPSLFRAFRREFYAMLKGASQAKKTPLIQLDPENKEDIKFVNLSQTNKDMEFKEWREDLRKLACALFLMDPAELGYVYGNEGQSGSLSQQGPGDRILASRERGLRPLLRALQSWINRKIISEIAPEYEFMFAGFDASTATEKLDNAIKRLKFSTYNEVRADFDLPEIKTKTAEAIGDPTYVNALQQEQAAEAQPEGGGDGDPGSDEGGEPQEEAPRPGDVDNAEAELFGKAQTFRRRITVQVD